ncbi:hypothetical protein BZG36_01426 [Bifiguratus adelaidae]|uniref:Chitin deacetylase n=1 Tax=Bifiguratus adelaidae TaxID=1938954 RepID=A0A261Y523_9FUNG|nr:hypothetical protein BZG36_01426 [Bifiguratus adelaidae]
MKQHLLLAAVSALSLFGLGAATCSPTYTVVSGDYAWLIEQKHNITHDQLQGWNPGVNLTLIFPGELLCLGPNSSSSSSSATKTTHITTTTTTLSTVSLPTGSPYVTRYSCTHYSTSTSSLNTCAKMMSKYSVSSTNFALWNPSINCSKNLPTGTRVCFSASTVVYKCGHYATATSSLNTCAKMMSKYSVSSANFALWNPTINCAKNIASGTRVCFSAAQVASSGPSSASSTTSTTSTPKPTSTNSADGCLAFYTVKSGDGMWAVENATGKTQAQLSQINPGYDFNNMQPGDMICYSWGLGGKPLPPVPIFGCNVTGSFSITFDDGPGAYTNSLLDYLAKEQVKTTFFINGNNTFYIYDHADALRAAYNAGHQIATHGWYHLNNTLLTEAQFRENILRLEQAFVDILGVIPKYYRPPYGIYNPMVLGVLADLGYHLVIWDIDSEDWLLENFSKEQAQYTQQLAGQSYKSSAHISLQHDIHPITVQQLAPWVIPYVRDTLHYKLMPVASCLGDSNPANWYRPPRT